MKFKQRRSRPPAAELPLSGEAAPLLRSRRHSRTSYIGREHDKETDLGFGACREALRGSVSLYEPEYGRFMAVDKPWEKYCTLQPYQYAANGPVMAVDRTGLDYDLIINETKRTATVKATFIVDSKTENAAEEAAVKIYAILGAEVTLNDVRYALSFDIDVQPSENPIEAASGAKEGFSAETEEFTQDGRHAVNSITTIPDDSRVIGKDAAGSLTDERYTVLIRERYATNTNVIMHEMFHALGGKHTTTGIMTKSLDDPFFNSFVDPAMFQQMVREPINQEQQRRVVSP